MQKFVAAVGATVLFIAAVLVVVPLGALGGAFAGYIVNFVIGPPILEVLGALGLHFALWKVGATLGFVGAYLRTTTTIKKD